MPTHDQSIAAAHELAAKIRTVARSAELARRPDDAVIAQAADSGLFGMLSPARWGGSELDLDTFFEVGLILGAADASHSWVLTFYIEHVWMFAHFPEALQRTLFRDRPYALAPGMLSPGRATAAAGGYVLSGRWPWGTGIMHADWVIASALVPQADSDGVEQMLFVLPRDEVTVEDTWHMDGMCATGSNDVLVDERFVPAERTVRVAGMMRGRGLGASLYSGPLYATPMAPVLSFAAALPVLGQAKACVAEYTDQLRSRYDLISLEAQSTSTSKHIRLAEADLEVTAAEALMRRVLAEVMAVRAAASQAQRVKWTAAISHAVSMCQRAVNTLGDTAGASSHRLDNPVQRIRRDINTMACHMVFDDDERRRNLGRVMLGMRAGRNWH